MSKHQPIDPSAQALAKDADLENALDCETQTLLRLFLQPIMETAPDWRTLVAQFRAKGYGVGLRGDRLLVLNSAGTPICTATSLGVPLISIMQRIGPPCHSILRF